MKDVGAGLADDPAQGTQRGAVRLLGCGVPLAGVAAVAVVDATQFPPLFDTVSYFLDTFARGTPFYSRMLYYYLTSILISVMLLLIAGIPAALYERIRGLKASTPVSLTIWLVAIVLLSLPTLMGLFAGGDEFGS